MRGPMAVELTNRCFQEACTISKSCLSPVPLAELQIRVTYSWAYTFIYFPVENGGSSWNLWELAIGEGVKLEEKDEKENTPLVDRVAIVAEVYIAVCQLYLRLWNTTLATWKLYGHKAGRYVVCTTVHCRQYRKAWYWLREGRVN